VCLLEPSWREIDIARIWPTYSGKFIIARI
jgi:hypothetical protein